MLHKLYLDKAIKAKLRGSSAISRSKFIESETKANIAVANRMANVKELVNNVYILLQNPTKENMNILEQAVEKDNIVIQEEEKQTPTVKGQPLKKSITQRIIELKLVEGKNQDEIVETLIKEEATLRSAGAVRRLLNQAVEEGVITKEQSKFEEKQRGRPRTQLTEEGLEELAETGKIPKDKVLLNNKPVVISHLFTPYHKE